jgi:hypothetical protein
MKKKLLVRTFHLVNWSKFFTLPCLHLFQGCHVVIHSKTEELPKYEYEYVTKG